MVRRVVIGGLVALVCGALVARADVVHLKNGNELRGEVIEDTPDRVVLKTGSGVLTFKRAQVDRVEKAAAPPPKPPSPPAPGSAPGASASPPGSPSPAPGASSRPVERRSVPGVGRVDPTVPELHGALVAAGERWVFERRWERLPEGSGPGLVNRYLQPIPDGEHVMTVRRLGLDEVDYDLVGLTSKQPEPRSWKAHADRSAERSRAETVRKVERKLTRETLRVSGRDLLCLVCDDLSERDGRQRRQREWVHIDAQGVELFPGQVKLEWDGVVVTELVRIEAPRQAVALPDPSSIPYGERWTWRSVEMGQARETTHVVTRRVPGEVELKNTSRGGGIVRDWRHDPRPQPERYRGSKLLRRETLEVSGRRLPCVVMDETNTATGVAITTWYHADEQGVQLFPGRIKQEVAGVVKDELIRIEPPPAR